MKKAKRYIAILLVLCALFLSGCGEEKQEDIFTLKVAMVGEPTTLDPAYATGDSEVLLVSHVLDNLMRETEDGVTYANAKSYSYVDNVDGTRTYTFHLRNDIKWSNGKDVTAKDYVYAWQRLVDPETESPLASTLDMLVGYEEAREGNVSALGIKALSDTTLEVSLSYPCAYFISYVCTTTATMPQPSAVSESADIENADDLLNGRLFNGAYRVGTLSENGMTLTTVKKYYGDRYVKVDEICLTFAENSKEVETLFEDGDVDVAIGVSESETATMASQQRVTTMIFNQQVNFIKNESLRKAMISLVDRSKLQPLLKENQILAEGLVCHGITTPEGEEFRQVNKSLYSNEEMEEDTYKNALNDANIALYNAGYANGASTVNMTMLCTDNPTDKAMARYLVSLWMETMGVNISLQILPEDELLNLLGNGDFSMAIVSLEADRNDASTYLKNYLSYSETNYVRYMSNAYDLLLRVAENSTSEEARNAYLEDAEILLSDDGVIMALYEDVTYYQVREDLTGIFADGSSCLHLYGGRVAATLN